MQSKIIKLFKNKRKVHVIRESIKKTILPNGFENLRKCNCSICSKRNAVVASVSINNLKVVKGETELREYTFNTHTAKHYFCSICGIYTHHQRRSVPSEYGFNIACV